MNTKNLNKMIFEYKRIYPDLTQDEILQLIATEYGIKFDVDKNYERYNAERFVPKKHMAYKKVTVEFDIAHTKQERPRAIDHLGHEFPNREAMCRHWGITTVLFHSRDAKGWDIKRILTTPVRPRRSTAQTIADNIDEWNKKNV